MGRSERIAIYDLGGGTFDLTVLDLSGAVFEVLATGRRHLTRRRRYRRGDRRSHGRRVHANAPLRRALEPRVDGSACASRPSISSGFFRPIRSRRSRSKASRSAKGGQVRFQAGFHSMDREELDELSPVPLLGRTLDVAHATLESGGICARRISTRQSWSAAPRECHSCRSFVQSFFSKPPSQRVNPDEVVALGAAMQAYALARGQAPYRERCVLRSVDVPWSTTESRSPRPTWCLRRCRVKSRSPTRTSRWCNEPPLPPGPAGRRSRSGFRCATGAHVRHLGRRADPRAAVATEPPPPQPPPLPPPDHRFLRRSAALSTLHFDLAAPKVSAPPPPPRSN